MTETKIYGVGVEIVQSRSEEEVHINVELPEAVQCTTGWLNLKSKGNIQSHRFPTMEDKQASDTDQTDSVASSNELNGNLPKTSQTTWNYEIGKIIKTDKWVFEGTYSSSCRKLNKIPVAVKILGASEYETRLHEYDKNDSASLTERHIREARHLLDLIDHPNIVRYINCCTDTCDGIRFFIFMELCSEATLEDRIKNIHDYPEFLDRNYCKAVILHLTQALGYMHSKRIYHRDIKPSNVLFDEDCHGQVVKISDFGFSKKAKECGGQISSTRTTGTDGYRPPESYDETRRGKVTDRGDVFSQGLVNFFILTGGKHPFGDNLPDQQSNVRNKDKSPILEGLGGPDAALAKNLIGNMLHRDETRRPEIAVILKDPYFWTAEQIMGFYIRVHDCLAKESPKPKSKKLFASCQMQIGDKVQEFFVGAWNTARFLNELASSANCESEHLLPGQYGDAMNVVKNMLLGRHFKNQDEDVQLYIQVIQQILEKVKERSASQVETWQSDECENVCAESDNCEANDRHQMQCQDGAANEQDETQATATSNCGSHILSQTDNAGKVFVDGIVYVGSKTYTIESLAKAVLVELDDNKRGSIANSSPQDFVRKLVPRIASAREARSKPNSQSLVELDSNEIVPTAVRNEKPICKVDCDFTLATEFLSRNNQEKFENAKRHLEEAILLGNTELILLKARQLIATHEEIATLSGVYDKQERDDARNSGVGDVEVQNTLLEKLNMMPIIRRRSSYEGWQSFKELVDKFQGEEEDRNNILVTAFKLCKNEYRGCRRTWKECFAEKGKFHKEMCENCACVPFAENAQTAPDTIFGLVKYVRNKLVHFAEAPKNCAANWFENREDILNFVTSAVPEILPHMVQVMRDGLCDWIKENGQERRNYQLPRIQREDSPRAPKKFYAPSSDMSDSQVYVATGMNVQE